MSYGWSHSSSNKNDVIKRIYCMKWNTKEPHYDWMVDLWDGTTFNMSVGVLMTYPLTKTDVKGVEAFKKNMMVLHGFESGLVAPRLPWRTRLLMCFSC